jgi:flagellar hook-length control protein FliK
MDKPLTPILATGAPAPRAPERSATDIRPEPFRDHLKREVSRNREDALSRETREQPERVTSPSREEKSAASGKNDKKSSRQEAPEAAPVEPPRDQQVEELPEEEQQDAVEFSATSLAQVAVAEQVTSSDKVVALAVGVAQPVDSPPVDSNSEDLAAGGDGEDPPKTTQPLPFAAVEGEGGGDLATESVAAAAVETVDAANHNTTHAASQTAPPTPVNGEMQQAAQGTTGKGGNQQFDNPSERRPPEAKSPELGTGGMADTNTEVAAEPINDTITTEDPTATDSAPKSEATTTTESRHTSVIPPRHQVAQLGARPTEPQREQAPQIDASRFVSRVARAFEAAEQRGGVVQLRLSPPELGAMRIELSLQQGALSAHLETETAVAKSVLLDNLPALRERLAAQDIRIERFDVDVRQDSGGGPPDWQAQQEARQQHRDGAFRNSPGATVRQTAETNMPVEQNTPLLRSDGRFNAVA